MASGSAGRIVSVESSAAAGFMAPLHAHDADEAVHVLEGALTVYAGDGAVRLEPGETFVFERGVPHTLRADSSRTRAAFTTFTRSAARYESFLRATGPVAQGADWASNEDAATVTAIAAAAEITVLGPPGALPRSAERAARAA